MSETNKENGVYTISTQNPDTGRSDDLLSTVRAAHVYLYGCAENVGASRVGQFSLERKLKEGGFSPATAHFMLLLYQLGIVAKVKRVEKVTRGTSCWEYLIAPFVYADTMITQARLDAALDDMYERKILQRTSVKFKKLQGVGLETSISKEAGDGVTLEQLAEAVAITEDWQLRHDALQEKLEACQKELAAAKIIDPAAVAEELLKKARRSK